jgi:hypothetical protein
MVPTIRVSDEVMQALRERAVPFDDTPDSVLRRLLDLDAAERPAPTRPRRILAATRESDDRTPQNWFALPLLQMLITLNGKAEAGRVLDALEVELAHDLREADREQLPSGETRWRKDVQFCRLKLVHGGYMSDARRGWWEITQEGRDAVAREENPLK